MTKYQMIDASNEAIRAKTPAISEASFEGVRGEALLAMKAELRSMKAKHAVLVKA